MLDLNRRSFSETTEPRILKNLIITINLKNEFEFGVVDVQKLFCVLILNNRHCGTSYRFEGILEASIFFSCPSHAKHERFHLRTSTNSISRSDSHRPSSRTTRIRRNHTVPIIINGSTVRVRRILFINHVWNSYRNWPWPTWGWAAALRRRPRTWPSLWPPLRASTSQSAAPFFCCHTRRRRESRTQISFGATVSIRCATRLRPSPGTRAYYVAKGTDFEFSFRVKVLAVSKMTSTRMMVDSERR